MYPGRILSLLLCSALLMTACRKEEINGNGITTTELRNVPAFTNVRVEGPFEADIRYGFAQQVAVRTDANVQHKVRAQVYDNTLVLSLEPGNYGHGLDFEVTVDMPTIGRLTHNSTSDVRLSGFFGLQELEVVANGVGDLTLHGSAHQLRVGLSGVGRVNAQGMPSDTCRVALSGVGTAVVRVHDLLYGHLSGVGDIRYYGAPQVDIDDTGVGQVVHLD